MFTVDITNPDRVTLERPAATAHGRGKMLTVGFSARNESGYECGNVGLCARPEIVAEVALGWLKAALQCGLDALPMDDPQEVAQMALKILSVAQRAYAESNPVPPWTTATDGEAVQGGSPGRPLHPSSGPGPCCLR